MSITPDDYMLEYYPIVKRLVDNIRITIDINKLERYEDYEYLIQKFEADLFVGSYGFNSSELSEILFYVLFNKYLDSYNTPRSQISRIEGWKYRNYISRHEYKIIRYSDSNNNKLFYLVITRKGIYNLTGLGVHNTSINTIRTIINFMYRYIKDSIC